MGSSGISADDGIDGNMGNVKPYNSAQEGLQVDILPCNHALAAYVCGRNMLTDQLSRNVPTCLVAISGG